MKGALTQLNRRCWWCMGKLMAISHAEVPDRDGNLVWVHKCCAEKARESFRDYTAAPPVVENRSVE